jgi:hypothetical protein
MIPDAVVTFAGTDQTCLIVTATIRHGRDDPTSQPNADAATCDLVGPIPAGVDIGTAVVINAVLAGTSYPRFTGRITDLNIGWETVDQPTAQMIAVGALADMGRKVIGDQPWPQESDGARANRIIGLAGVPTDAARTDPGTLQVLARDVDAQPALNVASEAAEDGAGMVWQTKDGKIVYADADHRRGQQVAVALDACTIPLEVSWLKNLEGLVNDVRIRYSVAPEGGEQPEYHEADAASITALGFYGASVTTRLVDAAAATARARLALARQARPAWVLAGVAVDLGLISKLKDMTPAQDQTATAALLNLEMHQLVSVTGLPAGSPYTATTLWVEGWTETISWGSWRLQLATSSYCRTSAPPRWDDVDPAWTWNTVAASLTWDGATCLPPQPPHGRWDDIAATLRWDQIPPTTTWDTWS